MSSNLIIKELNLNVKIDKSWTLCLDRDGVISKKINNYYVKRQSEFYFLEGSLDAIVFLSICKGVICR
jgi:D-glycero-D-manno-heptose 1,7-bisphosphate phosphatase/D-glycero-alpha-D-manno-heptose 1-phosphate guanylyltransferase